MHFQELHRILEEREVLGNVSGTWLRISAALHMPQRVRGRSCAQFGMKVRGTLRNVVPVTLGRSCAAQAELLTAARETMEHKVRAVDPKREKVKQVNPPSTGFCPAFERCERAWLGLLVSLCGAIGWP
jgi:hypothetical protein